MSTPNAADTLPTSFNFALVALSFAVSVFGSYTALHCATNIRRDPNSLSIAWLTGAAVALGGGAVWSMHFLGMSAFNTTMPYTFDPLLTITSFLAAVTATGLGFLIAGSGQSRLIGLIRLTIGGTITGLGVAAMHYNGMAAMRIHATITYNPPIVALSIGIAVLAATAALWFAFNLHSTWTKTVSATIMGIAVCGMHYTAMTAIQLHGHTTTTAIIPIWDNISLAVVIVLGATTILSGLLLMALSTESWHQHTTTIRHRPNPAD